MLDRINENLVDIDKTTEKDLVESVISLYLWVFCLSLKKVDTFGHKSKHQ